MPSDDQVRSSAQRGALLKHAVGQSITVGNEFAEVRITRVDTRNGSRLLIESQRSGQWVALCPLEVEALTEGVARGPSLPRAAGVGPELDQRAAHEIGGHPVASAERLHEIAVLRRGRDDATAQWLKVV